MSDRSVDGYFVIDPFLFSDTSELLQVMAVLRQPRHSTKINQAVRTY
ncbi:MAG: hypothetical protein V2B20_28865 [Pseudomonadota bacterium]